MTYMGWLLLGGCVVTVLAIVCMTWLAQGDRIDSEEDVQAREAMFDKAERNFWNQWSDK